MSELPTLWSALLGAEVALYEMGCVYDPADVMSEDAPADADEIMAIHAHLNQITYRILCLIRARDDKRPFDHEWRSDALLAVRDVGPAKD